MSLQAIKSAFIGQTVNCEFLKSEQQNENYLDNLSTGLLVQERLANFYESPKAFFTSKRLPLADKLVIPFVAVGVSLVRTIGMIVKVPMAIIMGLSAVLLGSPPDKNLSRAHILKDSLILILQTIGRVVKNALRAVPFLGPVLSKLGDVAVTAVQELAKKVASLVPSKPAASELNEADTE